GPGPMTTDSTYLGPIDEAALRRFEQAWRKGRPEPIDHFLPAEDHPSYLATLEELVHIELEFAWKAVANGPRSGGAPAPRPAPVESYLARFPRLNTPPAVRRLALQELEARRRAGDRPGPDEYRAPFPPCP